MSEPTPTPKDTPAVNNDNVRIGDPDLVFGVTDKTWGYVKNLTLDQGVEKAVAKNGKSQTIGVEYFNRGEKSDR